MVELIQQVENIIHEHFLQGKIQVKMEGTHMLIHIIDETFTTMSRVQRQKKIYDLVGHFITEGSVHAFHLQLFTPEEFSKNAK